jgi:hypothetical protein
VFVLDRVLQPHHEAGKRAPADQRRGLARQGSLLDGIFAVPTSTKRVDGVDHAAFAGATGTTKVHRQLLIAKSSLSGATAGAVAIATVGVDTAEL